MFITYCILAVLYSGMLIFSGVLKLRHDAQMVQIIHHTIGLPLAYFPLLAACEIAAALGLLAGIRWARLGIAASIGAVIYFIGAIASHIRVGDFAGLGGAALMLAIASALLVLRVKTQRRAA